MPGTPAQLLAPQARALLFDPPVAPRRWDHIALTGDYLWSDVETPRNRFRPLRTGRFRADAFRTALTA